MALEADNCGNLTARLSIMTAFEGDQEIEFYMNDSKGIIKHTKLLYQGTDAIELNKDQCQELLGLLNFPHPAKTETKMAGLDGVDYMLTLYKNDNEKTYSWWCTAPRGWEDVVTATNKLLSMVGCKEKVELEE